jgi:protein O-GlcNAc transferase
MIGMKPMKSPSFMSPQLKLALQHHRAGRLQQAEALYKKMPHNPEALNLLSVIAAAMGKNDAVVELLTKAIRIHPDNAEYHCNIGLAYDALHQIEAAVAHYRKALALNPGFALVYNNLGNTLKTQGKLDEAVASYQKALALQPDFALPYNNLGLVFSEQGQSDKAITCYRTALALQPAYAEAHNNLGAVFKEQNRLDDAIACYQAALALQPDFAEAYSNLGTAFKDQGKLDEAITCFRHALAINPAFVQVHSNLLLTLQYSGNQIPEHMFEEHVRFAQQFETPLLPYRQAHDNTPDPAKRLKIGYVSPDFRQHAVAYFMEPILTGHDKTQFDVFCYYSHAQHDDVTERLMASVPHWINCNGWPDERLAEQIRNDGIDILIDLAGHTAYHRLLTFARKPAPVQVTYLGYPATTGLSTMDYRLTDIHTEPPGMTEQFSVEQLWRLPETFCCYRAGDNSPAVIDHPPFEDNGYVTFGCFNNFTKVTDQVIALWARVLNNVPLSRLMLEIRGLEDAAFHHAVQLRFERLGIPAERLILIPRKKENQFVLYNRIDLALDPFPCVGGTTSLDSLWMGVPFVTLAGRWFGARIGVTVLANAGLHELIATTEEEYLALAVALACDTDRLKTIRSGLRDRIKNSPLMDASRFTGHLEQAYRGMWQRWCSTK